MSDRQMIADLLSALEYHAEQTRPIHSTTTAIHAAREHLSNAAPAPVAQPLTGYLIDKILETERMRWSNRNGPPTYEFAQAFARAIERAHGIEATSQESGAT